LRHRLLGARQNRLMLNPPDWTDDYFCASTYLELHPFPDAETTDSEVAALVRMLPTAPCRVLDVACGPGRHAIRLARRGFERVGLDAAAQSLAAARDEDARMQSGATFIERTCAPSISKRNSPPRKAGRWGGRSCRAS